MPPELDHYKIPKQRIHKRTNIVNNWVILGLQFTVSALASGLIFFEYVLPRLSKLSFEKAVLPMLLLQAFRFTGMSLLVTG